MQSQKIMLMNEADLVSELLAENCTGSKADAENALFNDEEETGNAGVDAINSNCEHTIINNDNSIYKLELSVSDSDASTLYGNWSDSCSTLESDTYAENKTINSIQWTEATTSAMHKWEFSYNMNNDDDDDKNITFLSESKNESEYAKEDKWKITLSMRLHINLPNDVISMENVQNKSHTNDNCNNDGNNSLVKGIIHFVELHCVVPSSLHTTRMTSHSQCTSIETKHHRLCVTLHINRALLLSIMQSLHCEEEETLLSQIRKSAQSISRNEHLTLVCYYVSKQVKSHHDCENKECKGKELNEIMNNSNDHNNLDKSTVYDNSRWHLDAYDVIAHYTDCTCNGITLLPEYRYHIKIYHINQEEVFTNGNTTSCGRPLCIALNKFWSLEFNNTKTRPNYICREECVTTTHAVVINNAKQTKTNSRKNQENDRINKNKKSKEIDNKSRVTELSTPGTRNCKRVRRTDASVCETTPNKRVSQCIKENTLSTPFPVRRKRSAICNKITTTTTRTANDTASANVIKKRKIGNVNNGMTQLAYNANEVLLTEESIVIYTTNIRLSFREMQRCANQHIILNPPYKYASRARILVAEPPMIRSVKLLSVIPFITHVVRQSWLKELLKKSTGGDSKYVRSMCNEALLHKHAYMEKRTVLSIEVVNDFSIASLLRISPQIRQCLFSSFCFWVHPNAKPQELPMNDLKSVIIASGGVLAFDSNGTNHNSELGTTNSASTQEQMIQMQSTDVTFIFVMPSVNVSRTSWRIFIDVLHTMQTMHHHHHHHQEEHKDSNNSDMSHAQVIALKRLSSAIFITPDDLFKCVLQQKKPAASTVRNIPFDVQCAMRHATALEKKVNNK